MAIVAHTEKPEAPKGASMIVQAIVLLVLTLAAIGAGWFAGNMLGADAASQASAREAAQREIPLSTTADGTGALSIVEIAPITTNLAPPADMWVRMEASLVFNGEPDPGVAEAVHQDLLAFVRTVRAHQVEGASGYRHFKSDLEERARIRSEGKVERVLIRTLIFE